VIVPLSEILVYGQDTVGVDEVLRAIFTLKDCANDYVAKTLLSCLTLKLKKSRSMTATSARSYSMALYGLQNLNDNCREVQSALTEIYGKMKSKPHAFNAQNIGNSLYGLKRMTGSGATLKVISALTERISSFDGILSAQNIGNSLYGLQGIHYISL
jgi:hypothetical protein